MSAMIICNQRGCVCIPVITMERTEPLCLLQSETKVSSVEYISLFSLEEKPVAMEMSVTHTVYSSTGSIALAYTLYIKVHTFVQA